MTIPAVVCFRSSDQATGQVAAELVQRPGPGNPEFAITLCGGQVAYGPDQLAKMLARTPVPYDIEVFLGPEATDAAFASIQAAGYKAHRLTLAELTNEPGWWRPLVEKHYKK